MKRTELIDLPQVRVLGRIARRTQPQPLFWAASGLAFDFTGSELWLEVEADYGQVGPWLSVEVNGAWIARVPLCRGRQMVCLARELSCGIVKHIRVLKDTQAMFDDPEHLVQAVALHQADGEILPPAEPSCRLEFVGDSLTSGEGILGAQAEEDWSGMFFGAINDYAYLTAQQLNAEYRTLSQSGWGVYRGWDNDPRHAIPPLYSTVCAAARGETARALGAAEPMNFADWQPDAVIVNLGTNDNSAFTSPEWVDPVTGERFKLRCDEQGLPLPQDRQKVEDAAVELLKIIRTHNPKAQIVWCYGMIGGQLGSTLARAVERFAREQQDSRCHFLALPEVTAATMGSRLHPGIGCHQLAAQTLSDFLSKVL